MVKFTAVGLDDETIFVDHLEVTFEQPSILKAIERARGSEVDVLSIFAGHLTDIMPLVMALSDFEQTEENKSQNHLHLVK